MTTQQYRKTDTILLEEHLHLSPCPTMEIFYAPKQTVKSRGGKQKNLYFEKWKPVLCAQVPQARNTWCMRQLVYIKNSMGKSPIINMIKTDV